MREAVESSTMKSVGYEATSRILEIEFESGAVYQYLGVSARVQEELLGAESKGRYFNSEIRDADAMQRGKRKFRFKHKLLSLDATILPLCLSVFDWAH